MSFQILASIRGEMVLMSRERIEIKEHHVEGKQLLTNNPHLLIVDDLLETFNLISWFKEWDHQIQCEYRCSSPYYTIKMVILPTLNDIYDDVLIHKKYNERKFVELSGESNLSQNGRFKIGRRILYNWFVASLQRLQESDESTAYIYMEITAKTRTEGT